MGRIIPYIMEIHNVWNHQPDGTYPLGFSFQWLTIRPLGWVWCCLATLGGMKRGHCQGQGLRKPFLEMHIQGRCSFEACRNIFSHKTSLFLRPKRYSQITPVSWLFWRWQGADSCKNHLIPIFSKWGFLSHGGSQSHYGCLDTKIVLWLDDLGCPYDFGNLQSIWLLSTWWMIIFMYIHVIFSSFWNKHVEEFIRPEASKLCTIPTLSSPMPHEPPVWPQAALWHPASLEKSGG
jgi:hypothetical protein